MTQTESFTAEIAEARLRAHLDSLPFIDELSIAPLPDLNMGGYFAFSVMPLSTGRAGETSYLISEDDILTAGAKGGFDQLIGELLAGKTEFPLEMETFVPLFLRFKVIRSGVVLYQSDGHVLLEKGTLPSDQFSLPNIQKQENAYRISFWMFDTDRYLPAFYDITIHHDGSTEYTSHQIE